MLYPALAGLMFHQSIVSFSRIVETRLSHQLLMPHKPLDIFRENNNLMLLDCGYKTNKYQLPLLNVTFPTSLPAALT